MTTNESRTSTCSDDQVSRLKDLTLEIWVPSLRCMTTHRIQMKTPSYCNGQREKAKSRELVRQHSEKVQTTHIPAGPSCIEARTSTSHRWSATIVSKKANPTRIEALPGFLAPQSAHLSLPGTSSTSFCRARSWRACCLLLKIEVMLCRCDVHPR